MFQIDFHNCFMSTFITAAIDIHVVNGFRL